ncbi:hypothetical protein [Variovorax sp. PBL-H6]|uniref:hypothetical protein n=1 Tax=Variovorax sp. PBL-H6 TaxID=434009 RepID=UPI0013A5AFD5|nr:hypothetical protein [Variovorax sp. PBL-H6]
MLKENDKVTVSRNEKTYDATVLGSDGDLFWLLVLDLKEVQRGHLSNVYEHQGMKHLHASEWNHKIEHMFDANGQFNRGAFWASIPPPEQVICQLKAYHVVGAFNPSAA